MNDKERQMMTTQATGDSASARDDLQDIDEAEVLRTVRALAQVANRRGEFAVDDPRLAGVAAQLGCDLLALRKRMNLLLTYRWLDPSGWTNQREGGEVRRLVSRVRIVGYRWSQTKPNRPERRDKMTRAMRAAAWDLTGGRCWYCGRQTNPHDDFWVDHVVPLERGGRTESGNLVPCCQACNCRKGSKDLEKFRLLLEREAAGAPDFTADQIVYLFIHDIDLPRLPRHWFYFERIGATLP
jgi:5-methylcytosine-specific restriction protein A